MKKADLGSLNTGYILANISSGSLNLELLGLTIPESSSLTIDGAIDMNKGTGTGQSLTVSEYLVLDGGIDLEGESQFFQNEDVLNLIGENGYLERDQEGTLDKFTYNYWSAPVTTNGSSYNLGDIMPDVNFIGGYDGRIEGDGSVSLAEYWIWKFANKAAGQYSQWQHMKSSGSISAGEGFTMKGPGTGISCPGYLGKMKQQPPGQPHLRRPGRFYPVLVQT